MKNVEMNLEGNILTIKVDITKEFGVSCTARTPTNSFFQTPHSRGQFISPHNTHLIEQYYHRC